MSDAAPHETQTLPDAGSETGLTGARSFPVRLLLQVSLPWLITTGVMALGLTTAVLVMLGATWGAAGVLGVTCTLALAVFVAVKTISDEFSE